MKTLLRCGFVGLILLGLASQAVRSQRGSDDSAPAAVLASRLERLNVRTDDPAASGSLTGHSAICDQPIHIRLLRIDGSEDAEPQDIGQAGFLVRYVFLGSVEEHPKLTRIGARWVWATVRFAVGLRSSKPSASLVQIALPTACPGLATMDWPVLSPWD
jgi:hypothetical protein